MGIVTTKQAEPAKNEFNQIKEVRKTYADTTSRQSDKVEAPVESAAPEKTEELSPQFASLARRERELRKHTQSFLAEKEALKAKLAEYETSYIPKSKLPELIAQDPTSLGLSYEQLTNLLLNQPKPEDQALRNLQQELQKVKDEQSQTKSLIEDKDKKAYEQAVNQIRREAKLLIESDPSFEIIKAEDATEAVVSLIEETFKKDGIILSTEEAAKEVEEYLVEEYTKKAQLKKIREKLGILAEPEVKQVPSEKQPIKTLTNAVAASSTPLTEKMRRERAIAAFRGQL